MQANETAKIILPLLPGHNCGDCGFPRCDEFAGAAASAGAEISDCPVLKQERYKNNKDALEAALMSVPRRAPGTPKSAPAVNDSGKPVGLIDGYEADFVLSPIRGEPACREILMRVSPVDVGVGTVIRYRPLGCPVTHFARVIGIRDGLLVVHVVGPRHRLGDEEFSFTEAGVCMVIGFEGEVEGTPPSVGETVRFKPAECMMQKVHSGVVVSAEGATVLLEGLDLKVWAPPIKVSKNPKER
jgi:uncharacterized Fe-S cluster-containing protein